MSIRVLSRRALALAASILMVGSMGLNAPLPAAHAQVAAGENTAPPAAPAVAPSGTVQYEQGDGVIQFSLALLEAGVGQDKDGSCVINSSMGYAIGDDSVKDNVACAGSGAKYQFSMSVNSGSEDRVVTIRPRWVGQKAREGFPEPTRTPVYKSEVLNLTGATVTDNKDGTYTIRFLPTQGNTQVLGWFGSAMTENPNRVMETQAGDFSLGADIYEGPSANGKLIGVLKADRDLRIVEANRMDQTINQTYEDTSPTYLGGTPANLGPGADTSVLCEADGNNDIDPGKPYRGISAWSNLTNSWNIMDANAYPRKNANGKSYKPELGLYNAPSSDSLTRYTLQLPEKFKGRAGEIIGYYNGTKTTVKLDDQGNPYIQERYTTSPGTRGERAPFKFFIPEDMFQEGKNEFITRMDTVDKETGKLGPVKSYNGVPAEFPEVAPKWLDQDPGNTLTCTDSTTDPKSNTGPGKGMANNNCAKQVVEKVTYDCSAEPGSSGCVPFTKNDTVASSSLKLPDNPRAPLNDSWVNLSLSPANASSNAAVCVGWKRGEQRISLDYGIAANGRPLGEVFANAKVYITDQPADGNNCGEIKDWTLVADYANGVNNFRDMSKEWNQKATGLYIVLPGEKAVTSPTTLRYRVEGADPAVIATAIKDDHTNPGPNEAGVINLEGAKYVTTPNFASVKTACGPASPVASSRIYFSTPSAGVNNSYLSRTDPAIKSLGRQKYEYRGIPALGFNNGSAYLSSKTMKESLGEEGYADYLKKREEQNLPPEQVIHRVYISKCLDVVPAELPPNARFIQDTPKSNNPQDCGFDAGRYIEQTWALSADPSDDPFMQPFLMQKTVDAQQEKSSWIYSYFGMIPHGDFKGDSRSFHVYTPVWAGPGQRFNVLSEWRLTGTPAITDPSGGQTLTVNQGLANSRSPKVDANATNNPTWDMKPQPVPGNYTPLRSATKYDTIVIPQATVAQLSKSVIDPMVPTRTDFTHAVNIVNYSTGQFGATEFIDVLPYNGDGRNLDGQSESTGAEGEGTDFHGQYWLDELPKYVGDDQNLPVQFTTDDPKKVSMCPSTANASDIELCRAMFKRPGVGDLDSKPNTTAWRDLTQEELEKYKESAKAGGEKITALRFRSKTFLPESNQTYYLHFDAKDNRAGDRYRNQIGVYVVTETEMYSRANAGPQPAAVQTEVYAGRISGNIYQDVDKDASRGSEEEPSPNGRIVELLKCTTNKAGEVENCDEVYQTITLGEGKLNQNGHYEFDNLPAGTYKVRVKPLDDQEINTEAGKNPENNGTWESGTQVIQGISPAQNGGQEEQIRDINFGYWVASPSVTVAKSVNDPEDKRTVDGEATFTIEGENDGDVPLTEVKLDDQWVKDTESEKLKNQLTCVITNSEGTAYVGEDLKAKGDLLSEQGANLAVGDKYSCTVTWSKVTQEDIDLEAILKNTASITGKYKSKVVTPDPSSVIVPIVEPGPALELTKQVRPADQGTDALSDRVVRDNKEAAAFVITGRNTGNVTLHNVTLEDSKLSNEAPVTLDNCVALDAEAGAEEAPKLNVTDGKLTLAPGAGFQCTVEYTVNQKDVDNRKDIDNTAVLKGKTRPDNAEKNRDVVTEKKTATIEVPVYKPSIALAKTAEVKQDDQAIEGKALAGETVEYSFDVHNTSKVTLRNVTLADEKVSDLKCPKTELAPDEHMTCTATHVLTPQDAEADTYDNTATVTGENVQGEKAEATSEAKVVVGTPKVDLAKSIKDKKDSYNFGDQIVYEITVTNTGTTDLNDVVITDVFTHEREGADIVCPDGFDPAAGTLAQGTKVTCTVTTEVTQEDLDTLTKIDNRADVSAKYRTADNVVETEEQKKANNEASAPLNVKASIKLEKSIVEPKALYAQGEPVTYKFVITNTGTQTLDNPKVLDSKLGADEISCGEGPIAPNASVECTADYKVSAEDAATNGKIENVATANATKPGQNADTPLAERVKSEESKATFNTGTPKLEIAKAVTSEKQVDLVKGNKVTWKVTVTNPADAITPVDNVVVNDPMFADAEDVYCMVDGRRIDGLEIGTLAIGQKAECFGTTTVTQDEVDAGEQIVNTASTAGNFGENKVEGPQAEAKVSVSSKAGIKLTKTVVDPKPIYVEGDEVEYSFVVENTGDVTLHDVKVTDPMFENGVTCEQTELAPGAKTTCTADKHVVTAEEADSPTLVNKATVVGLKPNNKVHNNDPVKDEDDATVDTGKPSLAIDKAIANPGPYKAGEKATFTIKVTNDGPTDLTDVKITDDMDGHDVDLNCPEGADKIAKGDSVTCEATITVTQDDVNAEKPLTNTATAEGKTNKAKAPKKSDSATITVANAKKLELEKTITNKPEGEQFVEGDTVEYGFVVRNAGDVTLKDIKVSDPMFGEAFDCGGGELAPGDERTCVAKTHKVTPEEAEMGLVPNTATASGKTTGGTTPGGQDVKSAPSTANFRTGIPALTIDKVADNPDAEREAGDTVNYTITAKNAGNTRIDNVIITDDVIAGMLEDPEREATITCDDDAAWGGAGASLPAGGSIVCKASFKVLQSDVDSYDWSVNIAGVSGKYGNKKVTPVQAEAKVPFKEQTPLLKLTKTIDNLQEPYVAGDKIRYTFKVENVGETSISKLVIKDKMLEDNGITVTCEATDLAAGAETMCHSDSDYTVTEADVAAGTVNNVATVAGTTPIRAISNIVPLNPIEPKPKKPSTVESEESSTTARTGKSALTLTKDASQVLVKAGDTITYTLTVANTGSTELNNVGINDPMAAKGQLKCADPAVAEGTATLRPDETATCTFTKPIDQADVDAGEGIVNTATATGSYHEQPPLKATATKTVEVSKVTGLNITKEIADKQDSYTPGDKVKYVFTVTNTGDISLSDVAVYDKKLVDAGVEVSCKAKTLAPNESTECAAADYIVTDKDADAGRVVNTAMVTGNTPAGEKVTSDEDTAEFTAHKGSSVPWWPLLGLIPFLGHHIGSSDPQPAPEAPAATEAPAVEGKGIAKTNEGIKGIVKNPTALAQTGADVIGFGVAGIALAAAGAGLIGSRRKSKSKGKHCK